MKKFNTKTFVAYTTGYIIGYAVGWWGAGVVSKAIRKRRYEVEGDHLYLKI